MSQLTLAESAMMAAVVKAPAYYSPVQNYDKAVETKCRFEIDGERRLYQS